MQAYSTSSYIQYLQYVLALSVAVEGDAYLVD